jgi:transcriptional regulator with XRE-family HTH domain
MNHGPLAICLRLHDVRLRAFGPRGKARFAARLGIRASTYQQYEATRVPPVDLLVRAAKITGCDLVWLLTGGSSEPGSEGDNSQEEPIIGQVRELVRRRPETVQSLSAFLALIDPSTTGRSAISGSRTEAGLEARQSRGNGTEPPPQTASDPAAKELIPVVGSTAAGPARFWREMLVDDGQSGWGDEANARLQRLLAQCDERSRSTKFSLVGDPVDSNPHSSAALIQFSRPDEFGILEFLSCPGIVEPQSPLVAWRIDGDSMAPRYRDGDFVLVNSRQPAVDGYPCVAHQRGQIGVNCKIFKREATDIVLVPVNEAYFPQRFPATELLWANRVLHLVRLTASEDR